MGSFLDLKKSKAFSMTYKLLFMVSMILCCFSSLSHAQWQEKGNVFDLINLERHQFKFNLISPGLSYELGLFKIQSASTS